MNYWKHAIPILPEAHPAKQRVLTDHTKSAVGAHGVPRSRAAMPGVVVSWSR